MRCVNIASLDKPKSIQPTLRRIRAYLDVMQTSGRPVERVTLSAAQYDPIMRSLNAGRGDRDLVTSLRYSDVPVVREGST